MNDSDPLAKSIAEWQHKHRIADDDPVLAVLELVRLQIQHTRANRDDADAAPPASRIFAARSSCWIAARKLSFTKLLI